MSCVCQLVNNTLATEKNVSNLRVCEGCNHFQILLEMSSITTANQTISNIHTRYSFQRVFFRKNKGDFTNLHNEKNQIWKFRVNGIVSVSGTHVNVYQIS